MHNKQYQLPDGRKIIVGSERFEAAGKSVAIVSVHTLKPLDREGLAEILQAFAHVIVIEEGAPNGSLAMRVKELAWDADASCRISTCSTSSVWLWATAPRRSILTNQIAVIQAHRRLGQISGGLDEIVCDKHVSLHKARLMYPAADLHLAKHDGRAEALHSKPRRPRHERRSHQARDLRLAQRRCPG